MKRIGIILLVMFLGFGGFVWYKVTFDNWHLEYTGFGDKEEEEYYDGLNRDENGLVLFDNDDALPQMTLEEEIEAIKIDEYNFAQLEKVKAVLNPLGDEEYRFSNIKQFNEEIGQDLQPIKNCYFIKNRGIYLEGDDGWGGGYIFGFKLESKKYYDIYGDRYFSYPEYDIPPYVVCTGICYDDWLDSFKRTVSNVCDYSSMKSQTQRKRED